MVKLISHLLVLAVGIGLGIWWGGNHPREATHDSLEMQKQVLTAKIEVLQGVVNNSKANSKYQTMLDDDQQKLADLNKQLGE